MLSSEELINLEGINAGVLYGEAFLDLAGENSLLLLYSVTKD
jgi:hypothetical protein